MEKVPAGARRGAHRGRARVRYSAWSTGGGRRHAVRGAARVLDSTSQLSSKTGKGRWTTGRWSWY